MFNSSIGGGDAQRITIRGYDLVNDLVDKHDFIDLVYLAALGEFPNENQRRMITLFMMTAMDHGLTPSALATRLTLHGAPESMQGAVAAGLLGAGSRYLGVSEYAARFLQSRLKEFKAGSANCTNLDAFADAVVAEERKAGRRMPGFGHPIHAETDPRSAKILELATECGYVGEHCRFAEALSGAAGRTAGKPVPLNAAGVKAAIMLDMGMNPEFGKGLTLIARVGGLVAHILEERQQPISQAVWEAARA